jgi:glucosamine 6-phosphate synthetase-like amidotransferase/phosphosugar isomerase protein
MAEFLEEPSEHRFSIKGSTPLVLSSQLSRNKLGVAVAEAPVWVGICDNRNDYVARFDITACLQLATQMLEEHLLEILFARSAG